MGKLLWKNDNLLSFWNSCFYSVERRFFVVEYLKKHFPGLYCLKKKVGKLAIFGTKTKGQPIWKNVKFSIFWICCFYSLEWRFVVLEYRKRNFPVEYRKKHFPGLYCLKKKSWKIGHFWDQNQGSTSLEKF